MTSGDMWAEGDELLSIEDFFLMQISLFIKEKKKKENEKNQPNNKPTNPEVCYISEIACDWNVFSKFCWRHQ